MGLLDTIKSFLGGSNSIRNNSVGGGGGGSWGSSISTPTNTATVGQDVSSPTVPVGSKINTSTGEVVSQPKGTTTTDKTTPAPNVGDTNPGVGDTNPGGSVSSTDFSSILNNSGDALAYLNDGDVNDLFNRYVNQAQGGADALAADIIDRATKTADAEYNAVLDALNVQGQEASTLAGQQKTRTDNEAALATTELSDKQASEVKDIEGQKTEYTEQVATDKEQLARAWRDTSLELQRVMRARGVTDSSFAASQETGLLRNFNSGLKQMAQKSQAALADFSEAVIETNKFYTRKKNQLAEEVRQSKEDIDSWLRQQVQSINAQKNVAVAKRLADINNALNQAQTLRVNVANDIAAKQLQWGQWLNETMLNYKLAVAEAAQGKVKSAQDSILESAKVSNAMFTLLENGNASFVEQEGKKYLYDKISGSYIPVRYNYQDDYEELKGYQLQQEKNKAEDTGSTGSSLLNLISQFSSGS